MKEGRKEDWRSKRREERKKGKIYNDLWGYAKGFKRKKGKG